MNMRTLVGLAAAVALGAAARGQTVTTGGATATNLNVSTINSGTVLEVTGVVSADRRYVGMAITPSFSTLDGFDTFVIPNTGVASGDIGMQQAVGLRRMAYRPAQVGKVIFVDNDKPLLAARMGAMDLKDVSMKDAVRKVADTTRLNIVLGTRGLEQAGVDLNARHDFAIPAGTVKETLLAILKIGAPEPDMVITAEDKVIQVATQGQADNAMVTKTYYLQDLLANLPRIIEGGTNLNDLGRKATLDVTPTDLSKPPAPVPVSTAKANGTARGARGAAAGSSPGAPVKPAQRAAPASTNILEVITDSVRPEIWRNHGGKAEISMVGDRVTIKAPQSVHAILEGPKVYDPNKLPLYVNYSR